MSTPVVLITGALTGIGRAAAAAFAKNGASVVASGRREAEGKALEAELRSLGAEAVVHPCRCAPRGRRAQSDRPDRRSLWSDRRRRQCRGHRRPAWTGNRADRRELRSHLRHQRARHAAQHEARVARDAGAGSRQHHQHILDLRSRRGGRCLGLCREQARRGRHDEVRGARRGQSGVRVNAVAPGPTDTGMLNRFTGAGEESGAGATVPLGRLGLPEELATPSCSSRRTRLHSSLATSSMSMAAKPTDPVRAPRFAPRSVKGAVAPAGAFGGPGRRRFRPLRMSA